MPIFEYKCEDCNSNYDIFHKSKENSDDIICPSCNSKKYVKLMSSFSSVIASGSSSSSCESGSCGVPSFGGCANGMCGLN